MNISSRTPEGQPNRCPLCGQDLRIEPSLATRDAPCPHCGHLLWFTPAVGRYAAAMRRPAPMRRLASPIVKMAAVIIFLAAIMYALASAVFTVKLLGPYFGLGPMEYAVLLILGI